MIRTPDQKLRVFVSSTLAELAPERAAAHAAIEQLRLTPILFELGARPHPPRALYRAYLEQSDLFVAIWWQRYGWVAPDMDISGLEDEYRLSVGMPRLFYLKRPAPELEDGLKGMISDLQESDTSSYRPFETAEELRDLIAEDLSLLLAERFTEPTTESALAPGPRPVAAPTPTTSLIGRDRDVNEITELLRARTSRLVTMTGVGGIGKTRLSLSVLSAVADDFANGGAFVDLSSVTSPEGVPIAIATALNLPAAEGQESGDDGLVRMLRDRELLLVLDNFEHLLAAAETVSRLLATCEQLSILVTSRALLRVRGERQHVVEPLAIDDPSSAGVQLFVERARDVRPNWEPTDDELATIADICRRLDGLPLAIEIAAAQARLLSVGQLFERLADSLDLPGYRDLPDRQRTLAATLDWSHSLLPDDAKQLLAWLSVFGGSFTLAGAETVCEQLDVDVTSALAVLLDHSLVSTAERSDGEPGFRLLDTVRQHARAQLDVSGDADRALDGLTQHVIERFYSASPFLYGRRQLEMIHRLDAELPNILAMLTRSVTEQRSPGPLIQAITAGWLFMGIRGVAQGVPDLQATVLDAPLGATLTDAERLAAYLLETGRQWTAGQHAQLIPMSEKGLELARRLEAHGTAGLLLHMIGSSRDWSEVDKARAELTEALEEHRLESGSLALVGVDLEEFTTAISNFTRIHLGELLLNDGEREQARQLFSQAEETGDELANVMMLGWAWSRLALTDALEGEMDSARQRIEVALTDHREGLNAEHLTHAAFVVALVAASQDEPVMAARILGAIDAARDSIGLRPLPMLARLEEQHRERIRADLGTDAYKAAHAEGRSLGLDAAIDLGLELTSSAATPLRR